MIVLQQPTHSVQLELVRVLRVTTQAWGLPQALPRQARPRKIAIRTQGMPWQNSWSRVPVQSLRWAI